MNSAYFNTMFEAAYCEQLIEEACNGDYEYNHFRERMSVEECLAAHQTAEELTAYAAKIR